MLSKSVCIRCSEKHWPELLFKATGKHIEEEWSFKDDREWVEEKAITCPVKYCRECHGDQDSYNGYLRAYTWGDAPDLCLRRFEQAVAAGMPKREDYAK